MELTRNTKLYFTIVCSRNCHNQEGKLEERCLNSEQIMRFRIDIEYAVVQRSSTTTTRIAVPGIDATPPAEEDHDGSAPVGG